MCIRDRAKRCQWQRKRAGFEEVPRLADKMCIRDSGTIFHMDCSHLGELYDHLLEGHGFANNPRRTMFYGLCRECREAEK